MKRFWTFLLLVGLVIIAGCSTNNDEVAAPDDPQELLSESASLIRSAETFRMEVRQTGLPYRFFVDLGQGVIEATFRRAIGQYVAPAELGGEVSINIEGRLRTNLNFYSRGEEQWFEPPFLGWQNDYFAEGFNPERLIAEDTGFQAALASLMDLNYEGATDVDGTPVYHLSGLADGTDVAALLVGLIEDEGIVEVDVYIHRETQYPVRIIIVQPLTDPEDPTTWVVDVYDIDSPPEITLPDELQPS